MKSTIKLSKKLFTLIILLVVLFSVSCAFAEDNATVSDVISADDNGGVIHEDALAFDVQELGDGSQDDEILAASNGDSVLEAGNQITVHVMDSYNKTGKTWTEDGVDLSGAIVKVYDSSNNVISAKTNSKGIAVIKNLGSKKYTVEVSYSTYEPKNLGSVDFTKTSGAVKIDNVMFIPDILLLVDYTSHNEKVDLLMNMSKRVAFISTTNFDESRAWLADHAKFIHIDMFADNSAYNRFSPAYLKSMLKYSPANINYNVAYTFGVYSQELLNSTGIHIVGANSANNTFDTLENTYIGSYFQAEDIKDSDVLIKNMRNYFDYVRHLINPNKYSNPTLTSDGIPLMSPDCGFYHPDLGAYTLVPEPEQIHQWINENPGYTKTSDGSLNWMADEFQYWVEHELNPTALFKRFENDLRTKFDPEDRKSVV